MKISMSLVILVGAFGCATTKVDHAKMKEISKVALVGFTLDQEKPKEFSITFGSSANKTGLMTGANIKVAEESDHASTIYQALNEHLGTEMGWQMLSTKGIHKNILYRNTLKDQTEGWQNRPPVDPKYAVLRPRRVMEAWSIDRMGSDKKVELMNELGVDALAIAYLDVDLEKGGGLKQIVGAGDYFPKARIRFKLFSKENHGEPVWEEYAGQGDQVEKGTEHVLGFTNANELNNQTVLASKKSFTALTDRYEKSKSVKQ